MHKNPCKQGPEGYLAALDIGFDKLDFEEKHGGAPDAIIQALVDTVDAAKSIGDAEGERFLCIMLADSCDEASETAGGRILGAGGTAEEAAAKTAGHAQRSKQSRARAEQIEAIFASTPEATEPTTVVPSKPLQAFKGFGFKEPVLVPEPEPDPDPELEMAPPERDDTGAQDLAMLEELD